MHHRALTAAAAAVVLATAGTTTTAAAAPEARGTGAVTLAKDLLSPLSAAVAQDGTAYVSQNFAGVILKKEKGKKVKTLYSVQNGSELGALSVRKGAVTFGVTNATGLVKRISRSGKVTTLADVGAYEGSHNPDGDVTYGFRDIGAECSAEFPDDLPPTYTGIEESHPYGTATYAGGTYVADAAANAVLRIAPNGTVSTVAVLPAVPVVMTAEVAEAGGMPACVVGLTYWYEPVPTDVERVPGGALFVSTLTGGPEDGSTGAQSHVYRISPGSHEVTEVAGGLNNAVGVAVARNGDVFVTELFTGLVKRVKHGSTTAKPYLQLTMPGAIEWTPGALVATTNVLSGLSGEPGDAPAGKLVRIKF